MLFFTQPSMWGHWTHNRKGTLVLHPQGDAKKCKRVHYNQKGERE